MSELSAKRTSKRLSQRLSAKLGESPAFKLNEDTHIHVKASQPFTVVVIGATKTGKTSIVSQLCNNEFPTKYEETAETEFKTTQTYPIRHESLSSSTGKNTVDANLQIFDTQGRLSAMVYNSRDSIEASQGVIIVISLDSLESYSSMMDYYDEVQRFNPNVNVILAVNKFDIPKDQQKISEKEINLAASAMNAQVCRVSALKNTGITELFDTLVNEMMVRKFLAVPVGLGHLTTPQEAKTEKRKSLLAKLVDSIKK
jgi:small GTP-binding protein